MSGFDAVGVRIEIDDDSLREIVSDPERLADWCDRHPDDPNAVALLRMLGRLDEAAELGRRSLAESSLPALARAVRLVRYAHVLHWQGDFQGAHAHLDQAAALTSADGPPTPSSLTVLASVLQHRAKCGFDHAQSMLRSSGAAAAAPLLAAALDDARQALDIRERIAADKEVIASSRQTLARIGTAASACAQAPTDR